MAQMLHGAVVAFTQEDSRYEYGLVVAIDEAARTCSLQLGSRDETVNLDLDQLVPVDEQCLDGIEDMSQFAVLNEATICLNLKSRYDKDVIYTNIGDILVSVNPCKDLPIFSRDTMDVYLGGKSVDQDEPAHIYSIARNAYDALVNTRVDQACIISGESGAGKFEFRTFRPRPILAKETQWLVDLN